MSPPTIAPADLERLGIVLLRGLALRPGDPAHLVHVRLPDRSPAEGPLPPDAEVDLAVARLDHSDHPLDAFVGTSAPDDWLALGVVAVGTVREAADAELVDTHVRTVQLVERGGAWTVAFAPASGDEAPSTLAGPAGPGAPSGRIDDALRRSLGLPTAPPASDTTELFTLQWLDRLVDEAAGLPPAERQGCTEAWAVSRHPAVDALGLAPLDAQRLVAEAQRLATWRDWSQLRRMCAAGAWEHPELGPDVAAWLDDGAFSRWALAPWPDLCLLVDVATAVLPARTGAVVARTLDALGLLPKTEDCLEPLETT